MNFSLFILDRLTIHYQNSQGVVEDRFIGLRPSFFWLLHNGRRSCFGGGGAMLSCTGLLGSDRDDKVSYRLDTSKEAVVSNKDVEKLGIPHLMHSHAMLLPNDLISSPEPSAHS